MRFTSILIFLGILLAGCSHDYESDTLDLEFYQWNLWPDPEARMEPAALSGSPEEVKELQMNPPSCGWEVLHRGNGKLVRIPTEISEHFSDEAYTGVTWFHCRYTLPELWDKKQVVLNFESAGYRTEVYLNEQLAGYHEGSNSPFVVDITEQVFYTRDNHLSIRISDPEMDGSGILGSLKLKVKSGT